MAIESLAQTTPTTDTSLGILLPCPLCGEKESAIRLHLEDGTFTCHCCENEFDQEDVQTFVAKWTRVMKWLESMPSDE